VKSPIHISLNTDVPGGAGYVRYSRAKAVRQDAIDEHSVVAVDLEKAGGVVGVELTSLDDHAFALARIAAQRCDLSFPDVARALLVA